MTKTFRLDEVATITMGQAPPGKSYNSENQGWPLIAGAGDFHQGKPKANKFTTQPSKVSKANDIILGIRASIGEKVLSDAEYCLGRGVAGVRPSSKVDPSFLWHWLTHNAQNLEAKGKGATFRQVSRQDIGEMEIELPSLEEQVRISAALGAVESARANRRRSIELLDELTQSIFLDMFGDPVTNPRGWETAPLTEACTTYSGGTPKKSIEWGTGLPWFSPKDIKKNDLVDSQDHLSEHTAEISGLRVLPEDTVVIVVRGMILRHTFPVSTLRTRATINQDIKALIPKADINPDFLAGCLRTQEKNALQQVSAAAHGTTRLDTQGLRKIPITIPPAVEQEEYQKRISQIKKLKQHHQTHLAHLDELFASVQQRAFDGTLWDDRDIAA